MNPARTILLVLTAVLSVAAGPSTAGRADALPDASVFLSRVRGNLFTDEELQRSYTYLEKRQQIKVSKLGKVSLGNVRLFEVYASPDPGRHYRRLIEENGVPIAPDELRRRDEAYRSRLHDLQIQRANETPRERTERLARVARIQREREALADDVFRVFAMTLDRRETVEGVPAIAVTLSPRPNAPIKSRYGKHLKKFSGTAWVSEDDHQIIKMDLECVDTVLLGWGFVGRLGKGSRLTIERRKINDEIWLPYRTRIALRGRSLLVRKFDVVAVTEFSNYRKFSVGTTEDFSLPALSPP